MTTSIRLLSYYAVKLNTYVECIIKRLVIETKSVTIRGINEKLDRTLKAIARESQMSVNQWILQSLRKITGLEKQPPMIEHHNLGSLAGSWTKKNLEQFQSDTSIFADIDEEIWKYLLA